MRAQAQSLHCAKVTTTTSLSNSSRLVNFLGCEFFLLMGLVIAAGEGDSHDSSSVILWDSYIVAFVIIPMMRFQSDLKECVEFRGIFHLQFLSLCKGLGFYVQGLLFFLQNIHFLCTKTWLEFPSVLGGQVTKRNISFF
jgi:hypothetical protein